jgi:hypothetical protein
MDLQMEKILLRSIAGSWSRRRCFSNFRVEEVALFIKLQFLGLVSITVDDKGWEWAGLTRKGDQRLQALNRDLPS